MHAYTLWLPLALPLTAQEKSEARWRDYAADHYFHYYYRYGEDEKGTPLADDHRKDDLLELAAVCCFGVEPWSLRVSHM